MTQSRNKCVSVNTNSQHVYYFIHIFVTLKRGGIETQPKVVVTQLCIHSPNTDSEMAYTLPNEMAYTLPYLAL